MTDLENCPLEALEYFNKYLQPQIDQDKEYISRYNEGDLPSNLICFSRIKGLEAIRQALTEKPCVDVEKIGTSGMSDVMLMKRHMKLREALEKLSCLGNGDSPGNSDGNMIAQYALKNGVRLTDINRIKVLDWLGLEKILRHARAKNESCSLELTNWIVDNKPKQALEKVNETHRHID